MGRGGVRRLRRVWGPSHRADRRGSGPARHRPRRTLGSRDGAQAARRAGDRIAGNGRRPVITRRTGYLTISTAPSPAASEQLHTEGYVVLRGVYGPDEIAALVEDVDRVFAECP